LALCRAFPVIAAIANRSACPFFTGRRVRSYQRDLGAQPGLRQSVTSSIYADRVEILMHMNFSPIKCHSPVREFSLPWRESAGKSLREGEPAIAE